MLFCWGVWIPSHGEVCINTNTTTSTLGTRLLYCQCSRQDGNPDKLYIEGIASYMEGENLTICLKCSIDISITISIMKQSIANMFLLGFDNVDMYV